MSTHKKPADILPRLQEWERIYKVWQTQYDALNALTKCGPDSPLASAMGRMWDAYSSAIGREIGDDSGWLDWYCWDNNMGANSLEVEATSGKTTKIKTVRHLAYVICYGKG